MGIINGFRGQKYQNSENCLLSVWEDGKRPDKVVLSPKLLVAVMKLFSDLKTAYLKNYSNEDKRY